MKDILFKYSRNNNIYELSITCISSNDNLCLLASNNDYFLWHKRFGHLNMKTISKISKFDLVKGLPKIAFKKDYFCDSCQLGKQVKSSFKSKDLVSTNRPLELLHLDLFGPTHVASLNKSRYVFVIVDDYSRFSWVIFLKNKNDTFNEFSSFCKRIQNQKSLNIVTIRSDHGGEFENESFANFCDKHGITHNFAFPRASPQNGIVERKNRTLQECAKTILFDSNLPKYFWLSQLLLHAMF